MNVKCENRSAQKHLSSFTCVYNFVCAQRNILVGNSVSFPKGMASTAYDGKVELALWACVAYTCGGNNDECEMEVCIFIYLRVQFCLCAKEYFGRHLCRSIRVWSPQQRRKAVSQRYGCVYHGVHPCEMRGENDKCE